jgi:hypothetical protein
MTTWVDDFTVDHFADGTYSLFGSTRPPSVGGGHAIFDSSTEWFDTRAVAQTGLAEMTVRADSQMYLVALGLISPDATQGVIAEIVGVSNTWEIAVGQLGSPESVSGPFTVPSGDWTFSLVITASAIHISDGLGQTLDLELSLEAVAVLAASVNLSPFAAAASTALLGVAGAVVDLSQWTYSTGGVTPGLMTPGAITAGGVTVGVVR